MVMKLLGAVLVLLGCSVVGFRTAAAHIREEGTLRKLTRVLDYMVCELQYKLTPLPDLCRNAAAETTGILRAVFESVADELDRQVSPNAKSCMDAAISKCTSLSPCTAECLTELGVSLGRFDLAGQMEALESVRILCRKSLEQLAENKDVRLRSYRTLGICCGAALVILFV